MKKWMWIVVVLISAPAAFFAWTLDKELSGEDVAGLPACSHRYVVAELMLGRVKVITNKTVLKGRVACFFNGDL